MKPEPLKDKITICGMGEGHLDISIKSAVEWAKLRAIRLVCPKNIHLHNRIVITIEDLDKAFEDVMKK